MTNNTDKSVTEAWKEFKLDDKLSKVNRLELIDKNGKAYTNTKIKSIILSWQDDDKTLKIFVK